MKNKLNLVLAAIQALAALVMIGAVKIWAPVCCKMLTLTTGKEVHMKCFYTGEAAVVLAVILLAVAVMVFLAKKDQKLFFVVSGVIAVLLFMLFTNIIGVCASPDMRCHATALWAKIVAAVVLASSVVGLLSGKEGQVPN